MRIRAATSPQTHRRARSRLTGQPVRTMPVTWLAHALFVEPSPLHPVPILPPEALPEPDKVAAGDS